MQAMIVFFVAMVCGALAGESAKVESKYAYPAGVYTYPAVAPSPFVVNDYQAFAYNYPVAAPYPYYAVAAAQPNKVSEKTSEVAAAKADGKYYVAPYPYGAFPYLQAKQAYP